MSTIQILLNELRDVGLSDEEIGQKVGTSQSIIFRLRSGMHKSTSFERGDSIRKLHEELVVFASANAVSQPSVDLNEVCQADKAIPG